MPDTFESAPLTNGNSKASRITITPFIARLPQDLLGGPTKAQAAKQQATLRSRYGSTRTDIPTYASGGGRGFFRDRAFQREFLESSGAKVGDVVVFQQTDPHEFELYLRRRGS